MKQSYLGFFFLISLFFFYPGSFICQASFSLHFPFPFLFPFLFFLFPFLFFLQVISLVIKATLQHFSFYFSFKNWNCTFGPSSPANLFLSCSPGSISDSCYVSSLCGCCRRDKLSSFCFNLFNGELSFSYSFKLYRLCNSSFKLDWQWEDWKINATGMCVFCTQWNISLEEMLHPHVWGQAGMGGQGSMLTIPGVGSWPLPYSRASPVSSEAVWLFQHQYSSVWLRGPGLKIQLHFSPRQWAGVSLVWQSSRIGFALNRWQYILGRLLQVQREPESLSITSNSLWFGWRDKNSSLLAESVTPFCSTAYSLPWVVNLQVARTSCTAISHSFPGHLLSNFLLFHCIISMAYSSPSFPLSWRRLSLPSPEAAVNQGSWKGALSV